MGRSINTNQIIRDTILQSNDNKKNYKEKDKKNTKLYYCTGKFYLLLLFITFAWKLGYSVCKRIK